MSWTPINHPQEVLREGQEIEVVILKMDLNAGRISLGMRQILPDPWAGIGEHYHVGDVVDCVVSRIVPFGAFVQLPEGIEGIVPNAEMGTRKGKGEALRPGSKVEAKITELRPDERKMTLSIRHLQREEETRRERQVVEEYQTRPEREEPRFTIGDALRAKEDHGEDE
jgi:4-hydroxy-3-methylbut-2-enyl diphosphate reductase